MPLVNQDIIVFRPRGIFSNSNTYRANDWMAYNGIGYIASLRIAAGNPPDDVDNPTNGWARVGTVITGPRGLMGLQGDSIRAIYLHASGTPAAPGGTWDGTTLTLTGGWNETYTVNTTVPLWRADAVLDNVANTVVFTTPQLWTGPVGPEPSTSRLNSLIGGALTAAITANEIQTQAGVLQLIADYLAANDYLIQDVIQDLINNTLTSVIATDGLIQVEYSTDQVDWEYPLATYRYVRIRGSNPNAPWFVLDLGIVSSGGGGGGTVNIVIEYSANGMDNWTTTERSSGFFRIIINAGTPSSAIPFGTGGAALQQADSTEILEATETATRAYSPSQLPEIVQDHETYPWAHSQRITYSTTPSPGITSFQILDVGATRYITFSDVGVDSHFGLYLNELERHDEFAIVTAADKDELYRGEINEDYDETNTRIEVLEIPDSTPLLVDGTDYFIEFTRSIPAVMPVASTNQHKVLPADVTGTADAIDLAITGVTAYTDGMEVQFFSEAVNTGAMTLQIEALGAKTMVKEDSSAFAAGQLASGYFVIAIYDSTDDEFIANVLPASSSAADGVLNTAGLSAGTLTMARTAGLGDVTVSGFIELTGGAGAPSDSTAVVGRSQLYVDTNTSVAFHSITTASTWNRIAPRVFVATAAFTQSGLNFINVSVAPTTTDAPAVGDMVMLRTPASIVATTGIALGLIIDGIGGDPVYILDRSDGLALNASDFALDSIYTLVFDGTNFEIVGPPLSPNVALTTGAVFTGVTEGLDPTTPQGFVTRSLLDLQTPTYTAEASVWDEASQTITLTLPGGVSVVPGDEIIFLVPHNLSGQDDTAVTIDVNGRAGTLRTFQSLTTSVLSRELVPREILLIQASGGNTYRMIEPHIVQRTGIWDAERLYVLGQEVTLNGFDYKLLTETSTNQNPETNMPVWLRFPHRWQDEGVTFTDAITGVNFAGAGVSAALVAGVLTLTIAGGSTPTPTHALWVGWSADTAITEAEVLAGASSDSHAATIPTITDNQYLFVWRSDTDGGDPTEVHIGSSGNVRNTFGAATALTVNSVAGQVIVSVTTQNGPLLSSEIVRVI